MDYVLRTNALTKQYKDFKALNGLTMNVPKGSIYGFVGRNGAGKTTLIRMVCGIQFPTDGSFELYGVKNSDPNISETRRRMGGQLWRPRQYSPISLQGKTWKCSMTSWECPTIRALMSSLNLWD